MKAVHVHAENDLCGPGECPLREDWGYGKPPTEPGLYLARKDKSFRWWHIIVEIRGETPYLSYRAWDLSGPEELGTWRRGVRPDFLFGPRIDAEPPRWTNR